MPVNLSILISHILCNVGIAISNTVSLITNYLIDLTADRWSYLMLIKSFSFSLVSIKYLFCFLNLCINSISYILVLLANLLYLFINSISNLSHTWVHFTNPCSLISFLSSLSDSSSGCILSWIQHFTCFSFFYNYRSSTDLLPWLNSFLSYIFNYLFSFFSYIICYLLSFFSYVIHDLLFYNYWFFL